MNFKKIFVGFLAALLCLSMVACAASQGDKNYANNTLLLEVPGRQDLYYDPNEKVVYIVFSERSGYAGYGYMSPYYAQNGKPYLYDPKANSLVEIGE